MMSEEAQMDEMERQMGEGNRRRHFLSPHKEPVLTPEAQREVLDLFRQAMAQTKPERPHEAAPGSPGGAVAPPGGRGKTTSEYGLTSIVVWAGIGAVVVTAALTVLSAFGYRADLEYIEALVGIFISLAGGTGAYSIGRSMVKKGAQS